MTKIGTGYFFAAGRRLRRTAFSREKVTCPYFLAVALLVGAAAAHAAPPALLASPFQDHAVLQRDRPIALWGRATPNEIVRATFAGKTVEARAGNDGSWHAALPAAPAGGPYDLEVRTRSGASQQLHDLFVGDVWLCSGQSNMVLQVHRALDSRAEIAGAFDDDIRLLTVANDTSLVPLDDFKRPVSWQPVTPATIADFSAACYFFARELRKTVNVPMGLINASWGGSAISAWLDEPTLQRLGEAYREPLGLLAAYRENPERGVDLWGGWWIRWWRAQSGDLGGNEPWNTAPDDTWKPVPSFGPWEKWSGAGLEQWNGMVWYRTQVTLTAAQAGQGARLALGAVDEVDQTFVNGRPVGNNANAGEQRVYRLAKGALHAGENSIVVNVLDTYATGGMTGPTERLALELDDGSRVPLTGPWLYKAVDARIGSPPRMPWEATSGLTTMANAMIAPLGAYGLRGVLWYQGESDVERAAVYDTLLAALMRNWRDRFRFELPFLIVQLANYGKPTAAPVDSAWARLREAQRRAVDADGNAALAVAIDIGESTDIHPANKQELARRLARAARRVVYGEKLAPSGPRPLAATHAGEHVAVRFGDVEGALVAYSA
ncbi:MAG TPA: sialate O-acetylesterase, partial [Gammaproteobacteria bacterium]|nr:sialate O-acetylesterase [Gammaproteobacteria bacterium]